MSLSETISKLTAFRLNNCKIWCNTGWYKGRSWLIQLDRLTNSQNCSISGWKTVKSVVLLATTKAKLDQYKNWLNQFQTWSIDANQLNSCRIWQKTGYHKSRIWLIQKDWTKNQNLMQNWLKQLQNLHDAINSNPDWHYRSIMNDTNNSEKHNQLWTRRQMVNYTNDSDWHDQLELQTIDPHWNPNNQTWLPCWLHAKFCA